MVETRQPTFPKAKEVSPEGLLIGSKSEETRGYIRKIMDADEQKDKQLQQFSELNEQYRQENAQMKARLAKLEKYEDLEDDTSKFRVVYIRNRVLIQLAGKRIMDFWGRSDGNISSELKGERQRAKLHLEELVEECLDYCVNTQWHIIKRRLQEKRDAKRPPRA
jgi:hypothetical protein